MRFIKWEPVMSERSWKVLAHIAEDKTVKAFLAGYNACYADYYSSSPSEVVNGYLVTAVENFVFEALIKPDRVSRGRSSVTTYFKVEQNNSSLEFGPKNTLLLIKAIVSGHVIRKDDCLLGRFMFTKQGNSLYCVPYLE